MEENTLALVSLISACVGLLSSVVLAAFLVWKRAFMKNPTGILINCITGCDIVISAAFAIGNAGFERGTASWLCLLQAVLLQQLSLVSWLLGLLICIYTTCIIYGMSINRFRKSETAWIVLIFLAPLPASIFILLASPDGWDRLVGTAQPWCWIDSEKYSNFQVYFSSIPMTAIALTECAAMVAIYVKIARDASTVFRYRTPNKNYLIIRCVSYLVMNWIAYLPWLIARFYALFSQKESDALLLLVAVFTPLQGLFHAVAFFWSWIYNPLFRANRVPNLPYSGAAFDTLPIGPPLESFSTQKSTQHSPESFSTLETTQHSPESFYSCNDRLATGDGRLEEESIYEDALTDKPDQ
ncbi:hypothetical protein HDU91_001983 [Kappamyces sp. JEL0680]|nr:hypothetical protein HDU91_001983 [Kappamyces sp. JEL0680]